MYTDKTPREKHYGEEKMPPGYTIPGAPPPPPPKKKKKKNRNSSDQHFFFFFTLLDRASFPPCNNTKIIKFGWKLFILWVISYGLSFWGFAQFLEFRGKINDSFSSTCANTYMYTSIQPAIKKSRCQWRAWIVNTCNRQYTDHRTEHNTRSIGDFRNVFKFHAYSVNKRLFLTTAKLVRGLSD